MKYEKLESYMSKNKIHKTDLAKLLKVSKSTIYRKMSNKTKGDFIYKEALKICDYYNISAEVFL